MATKTINTLSSTSLIAAGGVVSAEALAARVAAEAAADQALPGYLPKAGVKPVDEQKSPHREGQGPDLTMYP